jgi:hypothetical protein
MTKKLSLRARAALFYFANSNMTISATRLSEEVAEGRDAIRAAMKELRDAGFLETRRERVGNGVKTISYVTNEGFLETESWGLRSRLHTVYTEQSNTITNLLTYSYIDTNKPTAAPMARLGGEKVGYEFFNKTSQPDYDLAADRKSYQKEVQEEYDKEKARYHEGKAAERAAVEPKDWNTNHLCHAFSDRLNQTWNLKPWRMTGSRFLQAFNNNRKKYGTSALIELEMIDIFFTQLKVDSQTDSDMLWKLFISRFGELSAQARLRVQTPEKLEIAIQQSEDPKNWKGL